MGILKKLSHHSSRKKLKMLVAGIFYSKLSYCLPLYTSTWGLDAYSDTMSRFTTYTKEDNRKLQVLQNQVCRLIQGNFYKYKQDQSTKELLEQCGESSIHQLEAQRTVIMMKKILSSNKPAYLAEKIQRRSEEKQLL